MLIMEKNRSRTYLQFIANIINTKTMKRKREEERREREGEGGGNRM